MLERDVGHLLGFCFVSEAIQSYMLLCFLLEGLICQLAQKFLFFQIFRPRAACLSRPLPYPRETAGMHYVD